MAHLPLGASYTATLAGPPTELQDAADLLTRALAVFFPAIKITVTPRDQLKVDTGDAYLLMTFTNASGDNTADLLKLTQFRLNRRDEPARLWRLRANYIDLANLPVTGSSLKVRVGRDLFQSIHFSHPSSGSGLARFLAAAIKAVPSGFSGYRGVEVSYKRLGSNRQLWVDSLQMRFFTGTATDTTTIGLLRLNPDAQLGDSSGDLARFTGIAQKNPALRVQTWMGTFRVGMQGPLDNLSLVRQQLENGLQNARTTQPVFLRAKVLAVGDKLVILPGLRARHLRIESVVNDPGDQLKLNRAVVADAALSGTLNPFPRSGRPGSNGVVPRFASGFESAKTALK